MSTVKLKAWGFIASCVVFVVSLLFPCYRVVVEMDISDPYVRTIRIGTRLVGLALYLFAVWGIYIAFKGKKKLAVIPSASIIVVVIISLLYLYTRSQDFAGIFLVFENMSSYYIDDIATRITTHIAGGFFATILSTIAIGVFGYFLYSDQDEY